MSEDVKELIVKATKALVMAKHDAQEIQSRLTLALAAVGPTEVHALLNVRMNKPRRTVKRGKHLPNAVKTTTEPGSVSVSNINLYN